MPYERGRRDPAVDVRAEQERTGLERKLAAFDREMTRLIDAYQAGVIELDEWAARRQRIEEQGRMLRARVQEIEQQRVDRAAELRLLEGVDACCASIQGALETPAFAVQQQVVQFVVNRIVVEDSQVILEHVVPTGPVRLQTEHQPCENLRFVLRHGDASSERHTPQPVTLRSEQEDCHFGVLGFCPDAMPSLFAEVLVNRVDAERL